MTILENMPVANLDHVFFLKLTLIHKTHGTNFYNRQFNYIPQQNINS